MDGKMQLSDFDIGVILIIKKNQGNLIKIREDIATFMKDYYILDSEYFEKNPYEIDRKITDTFIEYMGCCEHPSATTRVYFRLQDMGYTRLESTISTLLICDVRKHTSVNEYEYTNGFHDFEYEKLGLSLKSTEIN